MAAIAAAAAVASSAIAFAGARGRLHRIEAITRVLKDVSADDPAFAALAEVRTTDAEELRRAQRSPATFLIVSSSIMLVLAVVIITYGDAIQAWSPPAYLLLAYVFLLSAAAIALVLVIMGIALAIRLVRSASSWMTKRRLARTSPASDPEAIVRVGAAGTVVE